MSHLRAFLFCCLVFLPGIASAWTQNVHRTICEIALKQVSAATLIRIKTLLTPDEFVNGCVWPDQLHKSKKWAHTAQWHYVNRDFNQHYLDVDLMFGANNSGDVLRAILRASAELRSSMTTEEEKLDYLRFLAHFIADIHQPLHCGHADDRGGNSGAFHDVSGKLGLPKPISLHEVWDKTLSQLFADKQQPDGNGDKKNVQRDWILQNLPDSKLLARWRSSGPWDWWRESRVWMEQAYQLDDPRYVSESIDVMQYRVVQAAVRLAAQLEWVFSGSKFDYQENWRELEHAIQLSEDVGSHRVSDQAKASQQLKKFEQAWENRWLNVKLCEASIEESHYPAHKIWSAYAPKWLKAGGKATDCR